MKEEVIRVETHQIKEGHPFYNWAVQECSLNTSLYNRTLYILRRGFGKTFSPHKSMFNPIKIDIEKKHPMFVKNQGVEGEGFTHCLSNHNTLSLTA